jgi:hypothetical protein
LSFVRTSQVGEISAHRFGMSASEQVNFDRYKTEVNKIIDYDQARKALLATLPDGRYELQRRASYELRLGPKPGGTWEKEGENIQEVANFLIIVDGKVRAYETVKALSPDNIAKIELMKAEEVLRVFGHETSGDAMVIQTKKKRLFRRN